LDGAESCGEEDRCGTAGMVAVAASVLAVVVVVVVVVVGR
jgi:hypothetical protein